MKFRIFALAFCVGFVFCFSAAAFFVLRFTGKSPEILPEEQDEAPLFLEEPSANFLLIFADGESFGPFGIVGFDAKAGRIPVFGFSGNAALSYGGVRLSAAKLCAAVSPEIFAGAVETELGIELSGYFILEPEGLEQIIAKTGSFDYVLSRDIKYTEGERKIALISGVQSMNGKKIWDVLQNPKFTEAERCDALSRMGAAFFNRRLRRFLPESGVYATVFASAETDVSAYDKTRYAEIIEVLCGANSSLSGHITNDTEKDPSTGLLWFSDTTKERVKKYFG